MSANLIKIDNGFETPIAYANCIKHFSDIPAATISSITPATSDDIIEYTSQSNSVIPINIIPNNNSNNNNNNNNNNLSSSVISTEIVYERTSYVHTRIGNRTNVVPICIAEPLQFTRVGNYNNSVKLILP